jgi:hypothetical protein
MCSRAEYPMGVPLSATDQAEEVVAAANEVMALLCKATRDFLAVIMGQRWLCFVH